MLISLQWTQPAHITFLSSSLPPFFMTHYAPFPLPPTLSMAATAVAAAFSSPLRTLKPIRSQNEPFSVRTRRFSLPDPLSVSKLSNPMCPLPLGVLFCKWRVHGVSAAATQEEPAVAAAEEVEEKGGGEGSGGKEEAVNTKLYFGNLPFNVDTSQLTAMIQQFATPDFVRVPFDSETGRGKGFGFATMHTLDDCNAIINNLDGSEFMGRALKVNYSDKPNSKAPLYPETEHKLFVGSLGWSVTAESLTKLFAQHGEVVGARVLYDGKSGKPRGFGFVCYATRAQMEVAIKALNGKVLEGRPIRVIIAKESQKPS